MTKKQRALQREVLLESLSYSSKDPLSVLIKLEEMGLL